MLLFSFHNLKLNFLSFKNISMFKLFKPHKLLHNKNFYSHIFKIKLCKLRQALFFPHHIKFNCFDIEFSVCVYNKINFLGFGDRHYS